MKKRMNVLAISLLLSGSILFSSCMGSFSLWNKLLAWNDTLGDKYVNELVFLALWIVPVYELAMLADVLVLNSIEFWSGENPVEASVKTVKGKNDTYIVKTDKNGYHIESENSDETVDFRFSPEEKTWSIEVEGESTTLLRLMDGNEAIMYLPDGSEMLVPLDQAGVLAYKQALMTRAYFAFK